MTITEYHTLETASGLEDATTLEQDAGANRDDRSAAPKADRRRGGANRPYPQRAGAAIVSAALSRRIAGRYPEIAGSDLSLPPAQRLRGPGH